MYHCSNTVFASIDKKSAHLFASVDKDICSFDEVSVAEMFSFTFSLIINSCILLQTNADCMILTLTDFEDLDKNKRNCPLRAVNLFRLRDPLKWNKDNGK